MKKPFVVFFDSGDTLIDESTEIRNEQGIVISAQLHEGSRELLLALQSGGFLLALVADGEVASFENMYRQHGLEDVFLARAISEALPERKPAAIMFQTAMDQLGLTDEDKGRVAMVGNNLIRDVVGANRFGITSILYAWSPRYDMTPKNQEETPDYVVHTPKELLLLLNRLANAPADEM